MRSSDDPRAPVSLRLATLGAILFLHIPILIIALYAFTTEDRTYAFTPPGLTVSWFGVILQRQDFWRALLLSLEVASVATFIAIVFGTLIAAAVYRNQFFGKETVSLLVLLPIALPGIVTGIALRSGIRLLDLDLSFWTIVIGHATFCIVTIYNNVVRSEEHTSELQSRQYLVCRLL